MKRFTFTGDDFGFSRGVNRAIVGAHERGVLTAASLMVTGEAADEAVALARAHPTLAVGLHLVLVDGRPALPPEELPRLCGGGRRFPFRPFRTGLRLQMSRGAREEARREIRAQLERFQQTGLRLSHVDGHHHFHLHPAVLGILCGLAAEFGIPTIRLPREELSLALALDRPDPASKVAWSLVFGRLRASGKRKLDAAGISCSDRVYGLLATGRVTERYLLGLIPRVRADRVEIFSHPADPLPGEALNGPSGSGPEELRALLSPEVRRALARADAAPVAGSR